MTRETQGALAGMQNIEKAGDLGHRVQNGCRPAGSPGPADPAALANDPSNPAGSAAYGPAIFRGSNAAASLKRKLWGVSWHGGYIFRGSNAAASLKLLPQQHYDLAELNLPRQ